MLHGYVVLLGLCFVTLTSSYQFIDPPDCLNDGYFVNGTCQCQPLFSGTECGIRHCVNGGVNYNGDTTSPCMCPPGFLGTHCQSVKCVGEASSIGSFNKELALSVLITLNKDLLTSVSSSNDDFSTALCHQFEELKLKELRFWTAAGAANKVPRGKSCINTYDTLKEPCEDGDSDCDAILTVDSISDAINSALSNSQLLIITNDGLPDTDATELAALLKAAVARKISIHVLVYNPRSEIKPDIYQSVAYKNLEYLATLTNGFFVTPFQWHAAALQSTDGAQTFVSEILPLLFTQNLLDIVPTGLEKTTQFYSNAEKLYIAYRDDNSTDANFVVAQLDQEPLQYAPKYSSGYFKIVEANVTAGTHKLVMFMKQASIDGMPVQLWTSGQPSGLAFTSAPEVDASTPFAIQQAPNNVLVGSAGVSATQIFSPNGPDTSQWTLTPANMDDRENCQFPANLALVQCNSTEVALIRVIDENGLSIGVHPVYCADINEVVGPLHFLGDDDNDDLDRNLPIIELNCSSTMDSKYKRTYTKVLGLMVENIKDLTVPLLIRPDGIVRKIQHLSGENGTDYKYAASICSGREDDAKRINSYPAFLNYVMGAIETETPGSCNMFAAISDLITLDTDYFYDLFVITQSKYNFTDANESNTLLNDLYSKRVRLHWLVVQSASGYSALSEIAHIRKIASATGGIAAILPNVQSAIQFFNNIDSFIGSELVHMREPPVDFAIIPLIQFQSKSNSTYTVFINADPALPVNVNANGNAINASLVAGTLSLYTVTATNETSTLLVSTGMMLSVRIYDTHQSGVSVAFTQTLVEDVDNTLNTTEFNSPNSFYPVVYADPDSPAEPRIKISQEDANSVLTIQSLESMEPRTGCTFNNILVYNWICSTNEALNYIEITADGVSRSFPFVCLGSTQSRCLHGGTQNENYECVCSVGWTGDVCGIPVCLNGGTPLSNGLCKCVDQDSGFFCEKVKAECAGEEVPYYHSNIGSLLFVVEETAEVAQVINSTVNKLAGQPRDALNSQFFATQIIIVTYYTKGGNTSVELKMVSSDPTLLASALTFTGEGSSGAPESATDALKKALAAQMTDRSLILWISSSNDTLAEVDTELLMMMAANNAQIEPFFANTVPSGTTSIALAGLGVPTVASSNDFDETFNWYVRSLPNQLSPTEDRLNVVDYGISCNHTISVFVKSGSGECEETSNAASCDYRVLTRGMNYNCNSKDEVVECKFEKQAGATECAYSVETIGPAQVGFGYSTTQTEVFLESCVNTGPVTTWLNIRFNGAQSPDSDGTAGSIQNFPYASFMPIKSSYAYGEQTPLLVAPSIRNQSCPYRYIPLVPGCSDNVGFITQIRALDQMGRAVQKAVFTPCISTDASTCVNGKIADNICVCTEGWRGFDCSVPVCENGGTPSGTVCHCPPDKFGVCCHSSLLPYSAQRYVTFLVDVQASETDLQQFKDSIKLTATNLGFETTRYVIGSTDGHVYGYDKIQSSAELQTVLGQIKGPMSRTTDMIKQTLALLLDGLPLIDKAIGQQNWEDDKDPSLLTMTILLDTTDGFDVNQLAVTIQEMKEKAIDILTLGFGSVDVSAYSSWGEAVNVASASEALEKIASLNKVELTTPLPTTTTTTTTTTAPPTTTFGPPPGLKGLKVNIFVMLEVSDRPNTTQFLNILKPFMDALDLPASKDFGINEKVGACEDKDTSKWTTSIAGYGYYNNTYVANNQITYCTFSYKSFNSTIVTQTGTYSPIVTDMGKIVYLFSLLTGPSKCICARRNEPEIPNLMLWVPNRPEYGGDFSWELLERNVSGYDQYLLPLRFKKSDEKAQNKIWQNMTEIVLTDTSDEKAILADLWDWVLSATRKSTEAPPTTAPAPIPPAGLNGLKVSLYIMLDVSNKNDAAQFLAMLKPFIDALDLPNKPTVGLTGNVREERLYVFDADCPDNTTLWNTSVAGFAYFNSTFVNCPFGYCTFTLDDFNSTIVTDKTIHSPTIVDMSIILQIFQMKTKNCMCARNNTEEVPSLMLWVPNAAKYGGSVEPNYLQENLANYKHFFLPLYFDSTGPDAVDTIWKSIPQVTLANKNNPQAVVSDLWNWLIKNGVPSKDEQSFQLQKSIADTQVQHITEDEHAASGVLEYFKHKISTLFY